MRVLVVEDELLVGLAVCDDIIALNHEPLGPYSSIAEGLDGAAQSNVDFAFVDINLRGEMSYPILDVLLAAGVPVALMTGYSDGTIPERYSQLPRLDKPFSSTSVSDVLLALVNVGRVANPSS